jgi:hypothetical protein
MAVFMAEPQRWFDSNAIEHKTELPGSTIRHFLFTFSKWGCWSASKYMADTVTVFRRPHKRSPTIGDYKRRL